MLTSRELAAKTTPDALLKAIQRRIRLLGDIQYHKALYTLYQTVKRLKAMMRGRETLATFELEGILEDLYYNLHDYYYLTSGGKTEPSLSDYLVDEEYWDVWEGDEEDEWEEPDPEEELQLYIDTCRLAENKLEELAEEFAEAIKWLGL